jgi:hypothetical protein
MAGLTQLLCFAALLFHSTTYAHRSVVFCDVRAAAVFNACGALNALRGSASCGWLVRIVTWCSAAPTYMSACRTTATGAVLHTAGARWCGPCIALMNWVGQGATSEAWRECRACLCQNDTGVKRRRGCSGLPTVVQMHCERYGLLVCRSHSRHMDVVQCGQMTNRSCFMDVQGDSGPSVPREPLTPPAGAMNDS